MIIKIDHIIEELKKIGWIYKNDGSVINRENDIFTKFLNILQPRPSVAVEIGTQLGLSAMVLAKVCNHVHTFDIRLRGKSKKVWKLFDVQKKITSYVMSQKEIDDEVNKLSFDFAFIDGNHHYENVKHDFELVKRCGRVLFDDYRENDPRVVGVLKFVKEINACYIPGDLGYWNNVSPKREFIYIKNIAPFDVERAGRVFKTGEITILYSPISLEIKACSHLVIIKGKS